MRNALTHYNRALDLPFFDNWTMLENFLDDSFWKPVIKSYDEAKVDIKEFADKVEVVLDAPGYKKADISIKVEDGILSISGEIKRENEDKDIKYIHREISNKSFARRFRLGKDFKEDKIEAKETDGFYVITVPKLEESERYTEIKIK